MAFSNRGKISNIRSVLTTVTSFLYQLLQVTSDNKFYVDLKNDHFSETRKLTKHASRSQNCTLVPASLVPQRLYLRPQTF